MPSELEMVPEPGDWCRSKAHPKKRIRVHHVRVVYEQFTNDDGDEIDRSEPSYVHQDLDQFVSEFQLDEETPSPKAISNYQQHLELTQGQEA